MDDILAKNNRHLFLEEKDNTHNSFISNINYAVENIDTIKTFNDNINNGEIQQFLEAYLEQIGTEGNAWILRLTEVGESILATTSGFNYATVFTANQDIAAEATIILPNAMKYRVGTHMLLVSWNGTVCYNGEQYKEIGAFNERSAVIKIKQNIKIGDKLEFRTIALADIATVDPVLEDAITLYAFPVNSLNAERTLIERFSDIVNVKDFGAKGDGVTDDTVAFAAASAEGGKIFCPAGTYLLSVEPLWASGKSIQLFTLTDGVNFTGTYGSKVGISSAISGLQMAVVRSIGTNEKALNIQQNLTDTAEYTSVVESAINTRINVGAGHTKTAWGIIGSVRSKSIVQTNKIVGGYFQGWRQAEGAANSVWGAVVEAQDTCATGSAGAIAGIEIDCVANGSCANHYYNWVGAIVVGMSHDGQSSSNNCLGSGIRICVSTDTNSQPQTRWHYGLELVQAFDYGIYAQQNSVFNNCIIDTTLANFASGVDPICLRLGQGQKITFSVADNAPCLYQPTGGSALVLDVQGDRSYVFANTYFSCPSLSIYGAYSLTGESSLGTSSATLAANKPGSTNADAPTTWIKVIRGEQTLWIPAFAD